MFFFFLIKVYTHSKNYVLIKELFIRYLIFAIYESGKHCRLIQYVYYIYTWNILATNSNNITLLQLNNINDEEPVFSSPVYDGEVPENSPAGTPIINVTAVDADKGMFGVVTYSLAGMAVLCLLFLSFPDKKY